MGEKGFTLLELLIVIIILAILTTAGLQKYQVAMEKARRVEAKINLKAIQKAQGWYNLTYQNYRYTSGNSQLDFDALGLKINATCSPENYFSYNTGPARVWAYRCTSGGKFPQGSSAYGFGLAYNPISDNGTFVNTSFKNDPNF